MEATAKLINLVNPLVTKFLVSNVDRGVSLTVAFECNSEFSFQIWITFWSNPRILTLTPHTSSPAQEEGEERREGRREREMKSDMCGDPSMTVGYSKKS